jgi:hypothetical protein
MADWDVDRLVALRAAEQGGFRTHAIRAERGLNLHANFRTAPAGVIRVEVRKGDMTPIETRTFQDCDPLIGDARHEPITWRGGPNAGFAEGEPIVLRFEMRRAELFSVSIEE